MMRITIALTVVAVLAACGVDGEPVRPTLNGGVSINSGGIYPSASVGLNKGPLSVALGL